MKKPIDKTKVNDYMLGADDNGIFHLMIYRGEITPLRAMQWLDAGIEIIDRSNEEMREYIQEQLEREGK